MSQSVTRRLFITTEQAQDEAVQGQLFSTFAAYGPVETVVFKEDTNYSTSSVVVQFQKLSSAERLQMDAAAIGRPWNARYDPPEPHVGTTLLLSSRRPLSTAEVDDTVAAAQAELEVKAVYVPGAPQRGSETAGSSAGGGGPSPWAGFSAAVSAVRAHSIGKHVALLRFTSAHDANAFLEANQHQWAAEREVYLTHLGPSTSAVARAVGRLLQQRAVDSVVAGDVLRGFVVRVVSNTVCTVDAGIASGGEVVLPVLMETQRNFLKVSVGDEVEVRVSGVRTDEHETVVVEAVLQRVVAEAAALSKKAPMRAAVPPSAGRPLRAANVAGGGGPMAVVRPGRQGGRLPPTASAAAGASTGGPTPTTASLTNVLERLKAGRGANPNVAKAPSSASDEAKALASKVFQAIQTKKAAGALPAHAALTGQGARGGGVSAERRKGGAADLGGAAERLCAYPPGLQLYASLLVRVERVGEDGLHARCVPDTPGAGLPVFVPAALVPVESGSGDWRLFAVEGEKMTVALLYTVAVGESRATLRCIASKKEADVRRAVSAVNVVPPAKSQLDTAEMEDGAPVEEGRLTVGTAFRATRAFVLVSSDIGVPPVSHFPGFVLRPGGTAIAPELLSLPIVLPVRASPAADTDRTGVAALIDVVVSEIVRDGQRGHYALALTAEDYQLKVEQETTLVQQQKAKEFDEVKRRLAAVLGDDAVKGLDEEEFVRGMSGAEKRPRGE